MKVNDDVLIERYLGGDMDAFEQLYLRYSSRLVGFIMAMGAGYDVADDIAQKTWIKVIKGLPRYRPQGVFRAWLFKIGHHLYLDEVRSAWVSHRVSRDEESYPNESLVDGHRGDGSGDSGPAVTAAAQERHELLRQALLELPDTQRETVLLRIDGDLTYREIAETMSCPLGTVLWRMKEAQHRLSKRLELKTGETQR